MRIYEILPDTVGLPDLAGCVFDPDTEPFCQALNRADIDCYPWAPEGYCPEGRAYVGYRDGGLDVLLCVKEAETVIKTTVPFGPVYQDSCAEFFIRPFADDSRYMNFEINAIGVPLIAVGSGRNDRIELKLLPAITASRHEGGWWAVAYRVSAELLTVVYGKALAPGMTLHGNFQHCDEVRPSYGCWNRIETPEPDFHRPEYFGELRIHD